MSPEPSDFDYQGHLVFNGLYKTERTDGSDLPRARSDAAGDLSERLPDFDDNPTIGGRSGYVNLPLREAIYDDDSIEDSLQGVTESLIARRYKYEKFKEQEAYYDGDRIQVDVPSVKDADIYWRYDDYMYFRGAKGDVKEAKSQTQRALSGSTQLRQIQLEEEFFLWLFKQYIENNQPSSNLEIRRLTDTTLTGTRDVFGQETDVNASSDLEYCVPLLAGILRDKSISMVEGNFRIHGNSVRAEVGRKRVYVKASKGDIRTSNKVRRIALCLAFIDELVEMHESWRDLDPQDRYPPFEFFRELYEACESQEVTIDRISDNVLTKYANLRNEDPSDWGV